MTTALPNTSRRLVIPVPAEFLKIDTTATAKMIATHFITFAAPLAVATGLLNLETFLIFTIPAVLILTLISSFGLHSLGLMGHEGTHFTLHPKRIVSSYIGVITSALVPFHFDMGFAISHNQHHRFTNTEKDPDIAVFARYKNFWSRLLLARLRASNEYLVKTLQLASGRFPTEWNTMLNLKREQLIALARTNIGFSSFFIAIYTLLALSISGFAAAFAMTYVFAILLSGLRPYLEHAGTDTNRLTNSRSWISPFFTLAYAGINYHLAHHISPGVPAYHIAKFHQWLIEQGYIQEDNTEEIRSIGEAFAVTNSLPYGSRRQEDIAHAY